MGNTPSDRGKHMSDEKGRNLEAALAAMTADRDHWKAHAEEAGRGFERVCRDYARVSAQLNTLTDALLGGQEA